MSNYEKFKTSYFFLKRSVSENTTNTPEFYYHLGLLVGLGHCLSAIDTTNNSLIKAAQELNYQELFKLAEYILGIYQ